MPGRAGDPPGRRVRVLEMLREAHDCSAVSLVPRSSGAPAVRLLADSPDPCRPVPRPRIGAPRIPCHRIALLWKTSCQASCPACGADWPPRPRPSSSAGGVRSPRRPSPPPSRAWTATASQARTSTSPPGSRPPPRCSTYGSTVPRRWPPTAWTSAATSTTGPPTPRPGGRTCPGPPTPARSSGSSATPTPCCRWSGWPRRAGSPTSAPHRRSPAPRRRSGTSATARDCGPTVRAVPTPSRCARSTGTCWTTRPTRPSRTARWGSPPPRSWARTPRRWGR